MRWVMLLLFVVCASQAGFAKKKPPLHPIHLNTASRAELQQVPGIGPSTADKILQMRKYLSVGKPPQSKQGAASAQTNAPASKSVAAKPAATPTQKKATEPKISEEEES